MNELQTKEAQLLFAAAVIAEAVKGSPNSMTGHPNDFGKRLMEIAAEIASIATVSEVRVMNNPDPKICNSIDD